MIKKVLLLLAILLIGRTGASYAQEVRTLSHGFSINLVVGIPPANYGLEKTANPDEESQLIATFGLQIGNRWYFGSSDVFKMGLMVNWFDITAGTRKNGDLLRVVTDASLFELGPIGSFGLSDDIALDLYYNLRPTGFAHIWTHSTDDPVGFIGAGISHAVGTAFRWRALNIGLEYVMGSISCEYTESGLDVPNQKLKANNFRVMIGAKF